uniref:NADH-ubiquinone oxidoreductase chain 4L n=1 Tax=Lyonsia norwegica TaxID=228471 RepID=A0A1U9XPI5_LYONO|nr:NADH dehydrogenase subunit 4L [Lyonsia norwegica]AQZ26154.1 NADH dehydrogenase subunit 4L [Lyonsia norwegica]
MLALLSGLFVSVAGLLGATLQRKHLLSLLLMLEVIPLGLYCSLVMAIGGGMAYLCLYFLAFASCGGAIGVSLLMATARTSANDYVGSLSFNKF